MTTLAEATAARQVLSPMHWPSLAQDLALLTVPDAPYDLDMIYDKYHIGEQELRRLLSIPKFQGLYKASSAEFKAQGSAAADLFRRRVLSRALSEQLADDAMQRQLRPADALKLLELLLKSTGALDKPAEATQVNIQNNVGVQLPVPRGLKNKKLAHLEVQSG